MQQVVSRKEAKEHGLKYYFTGKPCSYGHVSERIAVNGVCCVCSTEYGRKYREQNKDKFTEYDRKRYEKNKDKIAVYDRIRYEQNKEKILEQSRKYREQNKEKLAERGRKHYKQNKEKISERSREYYEKNKDKINDKRREWRKANPEQQFIRNSLNRCMDNFAGKREKAEKLLGYTCEQLRSHIESQFKEGMSWDNRSEWHIDHIKPVSAFIKEEIADPAIINALNNLQPLWAHENRSKNAKWDESK